MLRDFRLIFLNKRSGIGSSYSSRYLNISSGFRESPKIPSLGTVFMSLKHCWKFSWESYKRSNKLIKRKPNLLILTIWKKNEIHRRILKKSPKKSWSWSIMPNIRHSLKTRKANYLNKLCFECFFIRIIRIKRSSRSLLPASIVGETISVVWTLGPDYRTLPRCQCGRGVCSISLYDVSRISWITRIVVFPGWYISINTIFSIN